MVPLPLPLPLPLRSQTLFGHAPTGYPGPEPRRFLRHRRGDAP